MTSHIWTLSMAIVIIAVPIYCLWEGNKAQQDVISGKQTRLGAYVSSIILLWIPTLYLFIGMSLGKVKTADLSLVWAGSLNNCLGAMGLLLIMSYFAFSLFSVKKTKETHQNIRLQLDHVAWLMPRSLKELTLFTGGLSLSAGICEELLFRGFLWQLLTPILGLWPALLLSSILFGVAHYYQGWPHVLRTGVMGIALGLVLWLTESIWIAIALHALIDMYGGLLAYLVFRTTDDTPLLNAKA
ncbi:CPBP family intramembrane glutamic endopeptidase [Paraglaciecola chathamensis]|uniref:Abortive infection protein n=1 Tax=Paraglaciecola agarilytica NO2 TaxID=1125747 RepID=A0ABQ0IAV3_9ALTE|nr:CPBP family intramembrane glutamic endopeptidase [Paraglaciecola agarilytica]GAC06402.1 abortive infection protein [Paraglaciecola agarilytica NO2]